MAGVTFDGVGKILGKLGLNAGRRTHRWVLAVVTYLRKSVPAYQRPRDYGEFEAESGERYWVLAT
jgi:hypothetical protein